MQIATDWSPHTLSDMEPDPVFCSDENLDHLVQNHGSDELALVVLAIFDDIYMVTDDQQRARTIVLSVVSSIRQMLLPDDYAEFTSKLDAAFAAYSNPESDIVHRLPTFKVTNQCGINLIIPIFPETAPPSNVSTGDGLPDWCNVHNGLSDDDIRDVEDIARDRTDLTRPS